MLKIFLLTSRTFVANELTEKIKTEFDSTCYVEHQWCSQFLKKVYFWKLLVRNFK